MRDVDRYERDLMLERAALLRCMEVSRATMAEAAERICEIDRQVTVIESARRVIARAA